MGSKNMSVRSNNNYVVRTLTFFCLIFTSCAKSPSEKECIVSESCLLQPLYLQEAKNIDIPIPVGFKLAPELSSVEQSNIFCLSYRGSLDVEKTLHFYKKSMEQNGWDLRDLSVGKEGLLVCNKADKYCIVSIRSSAVFRRVKLSYKTTIYIFVQKQSLMVSSQQDLINSKSISL